MSNLDNRDVPGAKQIEREIKRRKYRSAYFRLLRNTVASLVVVASVTVLISMLVLPVLRVTGSSMSPTLRNDELVVCRKKSDFKTGDIVAFYYNNKVLLKRVIGVPGDVIDIDESGNVFVNGKLLDEPYLTEKSLGECNIELPYQVGESRIFVMGDNRATSIDSRSTTIGCVSEEAVLGKVILKVWPFEIL